MIPTLRLFTTKAVSTSSLLRKFHQVSMFKASSSRSSVFFELLSQQRRGISQGTLNSLKSLEFVRVSQLAPSPADPEKSSIDELAASKVALVELDRPKKRNAINATFIGEIAKTLGALSDDNTCRGVILTGNSTMPDYFSSGIDLSGFANLQQETSSINDPARRALRVRQMILKYQASTNSLEECMKPVLAAVHGACIGLGVELICAADIRYATEDTFFQCKEIEIGMAADVGFLQRFPKIVNNQSLARELCFTGRPFSAQEALQLGFVSRVFIDRASMLQAAKNTLTKIATHSPIAVIGTKRGLLHARDHSVAETLAAIADWNQAMLQSEDLIKGSMAAMSSSKPTFDDL